ncbi:hypothetical protein Tco_1171239 [Tanacetum coccineum]
MANLKYCDKHNMVAFLKKPTESEGFTKIVDFLKGSSLRYALTHNPTIYDSLVKQFWQTATVRTLANGIQQIIASIDNKEYIVTEASVRSTLQLANATSINNLPDAEIYEGLQLGGIFSFAAAISGRCTLDQEPQPSSPRRSPNRKDTEIPQSQGPTITTEPDEATTTRVEVDTEGATTITSGLDEGLDSGNTHESPLRSNDTPLHDVPTSESVEDSIKLQELSLLVPKLEKKIDSLENELKETKQTLGSAILTLVKKVKSLEVALKRKSKKVVVSDSDEKETKA